MPRGKIHTYELYRLTEGKKVMVAENVSRKILNEQYGLPADKILYAARAGIPIAGRLGKYRVRIHGENTNDKDTKRTQSIQHVSRIKTSSGCRFGG